MTWHWNPKYGLQSNWKIIYIIDCNKDFKQIIKQKPRGSKLQVSYKLVVLNKTY